MTNRVNYWEFFDRVLRGDCQCQTDAEVCWPCEASLTKRAAELGKEYIPGTSPAEFVEPERDTYRERLERARKHSRCANCNSWNVIIHIPPTCALSQCNDCGSHKMKWDEKGRPEENKQ